MTDLSDAPLYSTLADDTTLAALIDEYIAGMTQTIDSIEAAMANRDWLLLQRQAHRLKGSAGGYGFPTVSVEAGALELAVPVGDAEQIHARATNLVSLCRRICNVPSTH